MKLVGKATTTTTTSATRTATSMRWRDVNRLSRRRLPSQRPDRPVRAKIEGTARPALGARRPAAAVELAHLLLQVADLVAQSGRVLEPKVGGGLLHLLFERADQPGELVGR